MVPAAAAGTDAEEVAEVATREAIGDEVVGEATVEPPVGPVASRSRKSAADTMSSEESGGTDGAKDNDSFAEDACGTVDFEDVDIAQDTEDTGEAGVGGGTKVIGNSGNPMAVSLDRDPGVCEVSGKGVRPDAITARGRGASQRCGERSVMRASAGRERSDVKAGRADSSRSGVPEAPAWRSTGPARYLLARQTQFNERF